MFKNSQNVHEYFFFENSKKMFTDSKSVHQFKKYSRVQKSVHEFIKMFMNLKIYQILKIFTDFKMINYLKKCLRILKNCSWIIKKEKGNKEKGNKEKGNRKTIEKRKKAGKIWWERQNKGKVKNLLEPSQNRAEGSQNCSWFWTWTTHVGPRVGECLLSACIRR